MAMISKYTPMERFLFKIGADADSCWVWLASTDINGYGQFSNMVNGSWTMLKAHRVSYELFVGPIPDGLKIIHKCDFPACVRPDHLKPDTQKGNLDDMTRKGRRIHGFLANAGLTPDQVRQIRKLFGVITGREIARRFGVTPQDISMIKVGRTYRWVK